MTGTCVNVTNFEGYFVRDVTPCSLVEVYRLFRGFYCLHDQCRNVIEGSNIDYQAVNFFLIALLTLILKKEAVCSSETSENLYRNTSVDVQKDRTLQRAKLC
jgi:hypothetical protein